MNQRLSARIPTHLLSGNTLLILIIILCSSLSFLLGYFVGRTQSPHETSVSSFHEIRTDSDDGADHSQNLLLPPANTELNDQGINQIGDSSADEFRDIHLIEDEESVSGDREHEVESTQEEQDIAGVTPTIPVTGDSVPKSLNDKLTAGNGQGYYFAIQAGAFKSNRQAEKLRKVLSRKGYTTRVAAHGDKKVLYKVWIGRFNSKENAEAHALKFTKNERLKSFVVKRQD